jgi:hypothetical protein
MAFYAQDFSEYTVSVQPSDWTSNWSTDWTLTAETSTSIGGKVFKIDPGGNARKSVSWDDLDSDSNRDDAEVLVRFWHSGTSSYANMLYVFVRGAGAAANESAYDLQLDNGTLRLHKYVTGSSANILSATNVFHIYRMNRNYYDTYCWLRFRVNGTSLKGKVWSEKEDEPEGWQVEATDSALTAAGWIGVGNYNAMSTTYLNVDYFGVGTNGDSPPMPAWATDAEVQYNQSVIEVAREFTSPPAGGVNSPLICINT